MNAQWPQQAQKGDGKAISNAGHAEASQIKCRESDIPRLWVLPSIAMPTQGYTLKGIPAQQGAHLHLPPRNSRMAVGQAALVFSRPSAVLQSLMGNPPAVLKSARLPFRRCWGTRCERSRWQCLQMPQQPHSPPQVDMLRQGLPSRGFEFPLFRPNSVRMTDWLAVLSLVLAVR